MSSKKNIALIIPGGVGTGKGNLGVPVLIDIIRLLSVSYSVTVFQLSKANPDFVPEGFELVTAYQSNPLWRLLKFPALFNRHHRVKKFAAVHGFWILPSGLLAAWMGRRHDIPSITSALGGDAAGLPEINYGRLHKPLMRWLTIRCLNATTYPNALTSYLASNLKAAGLKRNIDIIPWGVDNRKFRFRVRSFEQPLTFLHVANFHPVKDQSTLLRAFAIIRKSVDAKLIIVGTGVDSSLVERMINELGLMDCVEVRPPVPYHQLPDVYDSADVLLHTSRSEGQSEVVTEAMMSGLLVCGTRVGLLYDLPDGCIHVPVGDYAGLADTTVNVLRDSVQTKALVSRAREWTSEHDLNWTVSQLSELYGRQS